jgi:hypothetical protein
MDALSWLDEHPAARSARRVAAARNAADLR